MSTVRSSSLESRELIYRSLKVWTGLEKRLLSYTLHVMNFGVNLSHTSPLTRTRVDACGKNQPESAATGTGGMGTDDTSLINGVEPNSFVAAGDRLHVHLHSSCNAACPGEIWATTKSSFALLEEPQRVEREAQLPK